MGVRVSKAGCSATPLHPQSQKPRPAGPSNLWMVQDDGAVDGCGEAALHDDGAWESQHQKKRARTVWVNLLLSVMCHTSSTDTKHSGSGKRLLHRF